MFRLYSSVLSLLPVSFCRNRVLAKSMALLGASLLAAMGSPVVMAQTGGLDGSSAMSSGSLSSPIGAANEPVAAPYVLAQSTIDNRFFGSGLLSPPIDALGGVKGQWIEGTASVGHFSGANYDNSQQYSLRYGAQFGAGALELETAYADRYGINGSYAGAAWTWAWSPKVYSTIGIGGGQSVLWPDWRTDFSIFRKLDTAQPIVIGANIGYINARQDRSETRYGLDAIWYASPTAIWQTGFRIANAQPGSVAGNSQYLALTLGKAKESQWVLRAEHAREAYQFVGPFTQIVAFSSDTVGATWRKWFTPTQALILGADYYHNPSYNRSQLTVGWRVDL